MNRKKLLTALGFGFPLRLPRPVAHGIIQGVWNEYDLDLITTADRGLR